MKISRIIAYMLFGFFTLVIAAVFYNIGYVYRLNNSYFLACSPDVNCGRPTIYWNKDSEVYIDDIQKYAVVNSILIGMTSNLYFIAKSDGQIQCFNDPVQWSNACQAIDVYASLVLVKPSPLRSVLFLIVYSVIALLITLWLLGIVFIMRRKVPTWLVKCNFRL